MIKKMKELFAGPAKTIFIIVFFAGVNLAYQQEDVPGDGFVQFFYPFS